MIVLMSFKEYYFMIPSRTSDKPKMEEIIFFYSILVFILFPLNESVIKCPY